MKYGELNLGQVEAIVNILGGMDGVRRLLSGDLVVKARSFTIWKTVTLGVHKSSSAYRAALKANGYHIGDNADQILDKTKVNETEIQVDLVKMTIAELGFKKGNSYLQICKRTTELGLELCPAEVGPALRLQYDQPPEEWIHVAMESIPNSGDTTLSVFEVCHNRRGEQWLDSIGSPTYAFFDASWCWVFVVPRK